MSAAAAIAVDAPAAVAAKATYALEELARITGSASAVAYPSSALPASEAAWRLFAGEDAPAPRAGEAGFVDFGDGVSDLAMSAFWHLSRWEERPGSARDERGRFPAAAALFDPEAAAADRLVERFREIAGGPAPASLTVALTHDIDTPWRWSGIRAVAGAAARAKSAALGRRPQELARELRGLAGLPRHRARGSDPNWCFERIAEIERGHDGRSTYFVMAGHHHPADGAAPAVYDRVRPAIVTQVMAQGDELGLHPSYTASERPDLIGEERERLEALAGREIRGVRFHYLRHDAHATLPQLDRLGFAYDSSQGYADRPGMRAGLSFPYRPFDVAADRPLRMLELAARRDGRHAGRGPLSRALRRRGAGAGGGDARAGGPRRRHRLGAVAQRPLRAGLRAGLGPGLRPAPGLGARARRAAVHGRRGRRAGGVTTPRR